MGVGASIERRSSEVTPLLNRGGGETRPFQEQANFGDGVRTLKRHGTFFEITDLQIPTMKIREDGVLVLGLPESLDPQDRAHYELGLFGLFFPPDMFKPCKSGQPLGFGTAIVPEHPTLRAVAEQAITFADHVMRYALETCGIEPKRFLDAAARYGRACEEKHQYRSVFEFLQRDLLIGETVSPQEQAHAWNLAVAFIEKTRSELEDVVNELRSRNLVQTAIDYCRSRNLAHITNEVSVTAAMTESGDSSHLFYLHCAVTVCCLKEYQAILSRSSDPQCLALALKAAATMEEVRLGLDPKDSELFQPEVPAEVVSNLAKIAASGGIDDVCQWGGVLESLLPLEGQATNILADLRSRHQKGGDLDRLIANLERVADPPRKVIEYLRR